jgi:hypothetical protein
MGLENGEMMMMMKSIFVIITTPIRSQICTFKARVLQPHIKSCVVEEVGRINNTLQIHKLTTLH